MNIKLTIERRAKIVESVYEATLLPKQKAALEKKTKEIVRETLIALLPAEFIPATITLPKGWFAHTSQISMRSTVCPMSLMKYRTSEEEKKQLYYHYVHFEPIRRPANQSLDNEIDSFMNDGSIKDNRKSWEYILRKEIEQAKKIAEKEGEIRTNLMAFLNSVKTYSGVLAKMPELERHLPDVPVKQYPIVANVGPLVNLLDGLGFDQGVKEKA